jgi:XTP/dITP diphosphohydrolase
MPHEPSQHVTQGRNLVQEYYMPTVLGATTNPGKFREYEHIFASMPSVRLASPNDLEVWIEVAETGTTFAENALLKARALYAALPDDLRGDVWVLGDDSGLEVDAMDGGPGVYSNRWAGPDTNAEQRNLTLLERLEGVPEDRRGARFKCVIALIDPQGKEHILEGAVEGRIARDLQGTGGFGYDPLFELPDGTRMSTLTPDQKNSLSHRGRAAAKAAAVISAENGLHA